MGSKNKRTIYLGLDYSDFTGGVTEVNRKMGLLDQQFKLATQEAKNYGTETDQLGVKNEYLTQKINLQVQKVEAAKKAYEDAKNGQKATEKQLDALQKAYLKEQTSLEKMNGALKENTEEMEKANKETKSFGDEIRGVASQLGLTSPLVESLASKFDGLGANMGNLLVVTGGITAKLIDCAKSAASAADDINTLSSQTGIATDTLQELQYASKFVDVEVGTMANAMSKLTKQMGSAAKGSDVCSDALSQLHIHILDSNRELKSSEEVFYEVIDALGKVSNETERDALAMEIFGKSARELNPLIEAGSKRLKELGVEAQDLGLVLSEDDLKAFNNLNDVMDKFDAVCDGLTNKLGSFLVPALTGLFTALSSIPVPVLAAMTALAGAVTTIVLLVKAIKEMANTASAIKGFFSGFDLAANKTTLIILGVVAAVIALLTLIAVLSNKGGQVEGAMNAVSESVSKVGGTVTKAQSGAYSTKQNAYGTNYYSGGKTWVGEAGPELVTLPTGSRIESNEKSVGSETNIFNITIDAKNVEDFNRVVELAKGQRMAIRRGLA